ncbi:MULTISPECIES: hypothetical protein [Natronococcus]|uniref:DUF8119 domain-containing protein n=1 Tax=Natronococcus amylolyticus DSM 10524 TaxID=1227497 RepID=L9X9G0_9EURY|nr:hypothetical protein [Natronococcus amylolyticus]ELY57278.1 hypothetical protein C491_10849 [Natronococcus amylolyticus DSM 10524]
MTNFGEWLENAREQRWGIFVDLVFAVSWVTMVEIIFRVLEGPTWAYYMFMLAGIVAYFGFVTSLEVASNEQ